MEASRFGFGDGVAAAYKFDPTDADIVAHYLLPRALNLTNPHAHAVIDDDPVRLSPWDLLRSHGHGDSDHAFFFAPPTDMAVNGGRKNRAVDGGTWQGQSSVEATLTLVREPGGGGAELDIRFKRYCLAFCTGKRSAATNTTGFVMHEYQIISPPLPGTMLARIRVTEKGREYVAALQPQQAEAEELNAAGDQQQQLVFPMPEQPAEADAAAEYIHMVPPDTEQPEGPSYQNHDAVAVDGEGSSGGQTYALYGGNDGSGMVAAAGYVPEAEGGGGEYYNNYCQYQQVAFQDQVDPSYQYQAVNAAATCDVDEGLIVVGSVMAREMTLGGHEYSASVHSAWEGGGDNNQYSNESFVGDGEVKQELDYGQ